METSKGPLEPADCVGSVGVDDTFVLNGYFLTRGDLPKNVKCISYVITYFENGPQNVNAWFVLCCTLTLREWSYRSRAFAFDVRPCNPESCSNL